MKYVDILIVTNNIKKNNLDERMQWIDTKKN